MAPERNLSGPRGFQDGATGTVRAGSKGGTMGEVVSLTAARERRERAREPWITKPEIAARFRVTERTIERWMKQGLPFNKPFEGGAVRYRASECDRWFRARH